MTCFYTVDFSKDLGKPTLNTKGGFKESGCGSHGWIKREREIKAARNEFVRKEKREDYYFKIEMNQRKSKN